MTDGTPISYEAAARETPVPSSAGRQIGTLEHVLQVPEVDVFDGIVTATKAGLRFTDADYVLQITRSHTRRSLDERRVASVAAAAFEGTLGPSPRSARASSDPAWNRHRGQRRTTSPAGMRSCRTGRLRPRLRRLAGAPIDLVCARR